MTAQTIAAPPPMRASGPGVLQRLSTLSERELKDIGLTRQDVADAGVPGTSDAILLLIDRRDARRRGRRAHRW